MDQRQPSPKRRPSRRHHPEHHNHHHEHHITGTMDHDGFLAALQDEDHEEGDAEHVLWKKWDKEEYPDTFGFLELAQDGGFSEVPGLYETGTVIRYLNAAVMVIFVVYNLISVCYLDWTFMFHPEAAAENLGTTLPDIQRFYLSQSIVRKVVAGLGSNMTNAQYGSVNILGFLEFMGLVGILLRLVYDTWKLKFNRGFTRWFKCQKIFFETIPSLSVYSGMRLLYCVIPSVLITDVLEVVELVENARKDIKLAPGAVQQVLQWLFCTSAKFIVGFDTFLMKLRIVTAAASSPNLSLMAFLPTVQFLIQVVGVVQLGPFTRKRLFIFIFGGEDGVMQEDELVNMNTWNALLTKRIYHHSKNFLRFLVVMLSFSDMDFQSLVLNENQEKKEELHTGAVSMSHSAFGMWRSVEKFTDVEQGTARKASKCCCFQGFARAPKKNVLLPKTKQLEQDGPGPRVHFSELPEDIGQDSRIS